MKNGTLYEIVSNCLRMDELAVDVYRNLSNSAENIELKKFWTHMSEEESRHIICWKDLLSLVDDGIIPQIFPDPEKTLNELKENVLKIVDVFARSTEKENLVNSFVLAFRLEFYLVHPALEKLWNFYGIIRKGEYNPEQEYENHVSQFIEAMHKFGANTLELEVLGETIERMWIQSNNMAIDSHLDDLTGVLNRRGLMNALISLAYLAKRNGYNSAVLMIDIDHFKNVNDTLGHQFGDKVLEKVAGTIKSQLRASDIVGRYGGEEFLVFLPQIEKENLFNIADKIRLAIKENKYEGASVTVSIGGASTIFTEEVEDQIYKLIGKADTYLYEAKNKGRDQIACC